jgi:hypothetical protein
LPYIGEMARLLETFKEAAASRGPLTRRIVAAAFCLLTCGVSMAQPQDQSAPGAQEFVVAPGQTFYLDLDSPGGKFSEWRHEDVKSLSGLRAVVRVPRIRKDSKWLPAFTISLESNDDENSANALGLQLATGRNKKPPLSIRLIGRLNGKPIEAIPLQKSLALDEKVAIEMSWPTPKAIVVTVGDESHTINVPWTVGKVVISGSTGEVKVDPLTFASAVH